MWVSILEDLNIAQCAHHPTLELLNAVCFICKSMVKIPLLANSHNHMSDVPEADTWAHCVRLVIFCRIGGVLLAFGLLTLSTEQIQSVGPLIPG